jgi:hypothetical protein
LFEGTIPYDLKPGSLAAPGVMSRDRSDGLEIVSAEAGSDGEANRQFAFTPLQFLFELFEHLKLHLIWDAPC